MVQSPSSDRSLLPKKLEEPPVGLLETRLPFAAETCLPDIHQRQRERKAAAPTKTQAEWNDIEGPFTELYIAQGKPLEEIRGILEQEEGFDATIPQYKRMISKWGLKKNIRKEEYIYMNSKEAERNASDPKKRTRYTVRNRRVEPAKRQRFNIEHPNLAGPSNFNRPDIAYSSESASRASEDVNSEVSLITRSLGQMRLRLDENFEENGSSIEDLPGSVDSTVPALMHPPEDEVEKVFNLYVNVLECDLQAEDDEQSTSDQTSSRQELKSNKSAALSLLHPKLEHWLSYGMFKLTSDLNMTLLDPQNDMNTAHLVPHVARDWGIIHSGLEKFFPGLIRDCHSYDDYMIREEKFQQHHIIITESCQLPSDRTRQGSESFIILCNWPLFSGIPQVDKLWCISEVLKKMFLQMIGGRSSWPLLFQLLCGIASHHITLPSEIQILFHGFLHLIPIIKDDERDRLIFDAFIKAHPETFSEFDEPLSETFRWLLKEQNYGFGELFRKFIHFFDPFLDLLPKDTNATEGMNEITTDPVSFWDLCDGSFADKSIAGYAFRCITWIRIAQIQPALAALFVVDDSGPVSLDIDLLKRSKTELESMEFLGVWSDIKAWYWLWIFAAAHHAREELPSFTNWRAWIAYNLGLRFLAFPSVERKIYINALERIDFEKAKEDLKESCAQET